jgi:hypothetical protein
MFYMEAVYLQMAASRELAKERPRGKDEHDARPKAGCSARARSSHEEAPQQAGPYAVNPGRGSSRGNRGMISCCATWSMPGTRTSTPYN